MKKTSYFLLPLILLLNTSFNIKTNIKTNKDVINYLNTSDILSYNKTDYKLAWSLHPVSNYYKQEYIPKRESVDHYDSMLLVDFLVIDTPAFDMVKVKISELIARKKNDMVTNYELQKNQDSGEFLLDFILSDGNSEAVSVVELNGYRYKNYTDKAGHKGGLMFGISKRAYDDDALRFLQHLSYIRKDMLKTLTAYDIPEVNVN